MSDQGEHAEPRHAATGGGNVPGQGAPGQADPGQANMDWLYRGRDAEGGYEPTVVMPAEPPRHAGGVPQDPRNPPGATPNSGAGYLPPTYSQHAGSYSARPQGPAAPPPQAPPPQGPPQAAWSAPRPVAAAPRGRRRRRRHPLRWLATLLVLTLVWFLGVPALALARSSRVDDTPSGSRPAEQPGTAILLVGSDSREGLTDEERAKYGVGNADGNRTDTMMILYVPPSGAAALISLPRDSYVAIPGHGKNKLNAAYAFGGAPLLVQTVEQTTGVRIDGYLSVGLVGFAKMVDAVNGIDICLDKPMKDAGSKANFPAGCQTMNGTEALSYVRMRKADPRGDLGRVERQREVIGKVADKVLSPGTLLNPIAYWQVCMAAGQALSRGTDTGVVDLVAVLRGFAQVGSGKGLSGTVPISNPGATTPAGSSVIWNDAEASKMFAIIASGTTAGLDQYLK